LEAEILPTQTADQTRTTLPWEILLENHQQIDACALVLRNQYPAQSFLNGQIALCGRGKHLGRAAILKPAQVKELRKRVAAGEDKAAVAKDFGISRASVYNYMAS
jgi:Helix-turn-helix domain of resolvase